MQRLIHSTPLFLTIFPTVLTQTNGYDCGVHVCRYVTNIADPEYNLRVKMTDIMNNFTNSITGHEMFDFTEGDIDRMRGEIYNVMANVRKCYKNHRDVNEVFDLASDSDDEEDDVQILDNFENDESDDSFVDNTDQCSNSDAVFYEDVEDVSDDELSVDTTGK